MKLGRRRRAVVTACAAGSMALGVAGLGQARGEVRSFDAIASEWLEPLNWTPAGVPTELDTVLINAGTSDMSISSGSLTIGGFIYDNASDRLLGNSTTGTGNSTLTLRGSGTTPLAGSIRTASRFTIKGANNDATGMGTGTLSLNLDSDAVFDVVAGGTLNISAAIGEMGGSRNLTLAGSGTVILSNVMTHTGVTRLRGENALRIIDHALGSASDTSRVIIEDGATLLLDNSVVVNSNRINDAAVIEMGGGVLAINGFDDPVSITTETLGALHLVRGHNVISAGGHDPLNRPAILNFTATFVNGRYATSNFQLASSGGGVVFTSPPALTNGILHPARGRWSRTRATTSAPIR